MSRKPQEDTRTRAERLQAILRLIREHSISPAGRAAGIPERRGL